MMEFAADLEAQGVRGHRQHGRAGMGAVGDESIVRRLRSSGSASVQPRAGPRYSSEGAHLVDHAGMRLQHPIVNEHEGTSIGQLPNGEKLMTAARGMRQGTDRPGIAAHGTLVTRQAPTLVRC